MDSQSLYDVWNLALDTRLAKKQTSIRLSILVAAKIEALCDVFPNRRKTDIIAELLSLAIRQMEKTLPMEPGETVEDDDGVLSIKAGGVLGNYEDRVEYHLRRLEKEAGAKPLTYHKTYMRPEKWEELGFDVPS